MSLSTWPSRIGSPHQMGGGDEILAITLFLLLQAQIALGQRQAHLVEIDDELGDLGRSLRRAAIVNEPVNNCRVASRSRSIGRVTLADTRQAIEDA